MSSGAPRLGHVIGTRHVFLGRGGVGQLLPTRWLGRDQVFPDPAEPRSSLVTSSPTCRTWPSTRQDVVHVVMCRMWIADIFLTGSIVQECMNHETIPIGLFDTQLSVIYVSSVRRYMHVGS